MKEIRPGEILVVLRRYPVILRIGERVYSWFRKSAGERLLMRTCIVDQMTQSLLPCPRLALQTFVAIGVGVFRQMREGHNRQTSQPAERGPERGRCGVDFF